MERDQQSGTGETVKAPEHREEKQCNAPDRCIFEQLIPRARFLYHMLSDRPKYEEETLALTKSFSIMCAALLDSDLIDVAEIVEALVLTLKRVCDVFDEKVRRGECIAVPKPPEGTHPAINTSKFKN